MSHWNHFLLSTTCTICFGDGHCDVSNDPCNFWEISCISRIHYACCPQPVVLPIMIRKKFIQIWRGTWRLLDNTWIVHPEVRYRRLLDVAKRQCWKKQQPLHFDIKVYQLLVNINWSWWSCGRKTFALRWILYSN